MHHQITTKKGRRNSEQSNHLPAIEPLESRQLLSTSVLTGQFVATLPSTIQSGQPVGTEFSITSVGGSAQGTELTDYFLSTTRDLSGVVSQIGSSTENIFITDESSYTEHVSVTVPTSVPSGTYYIVVEMNVNGAIAGAQQGSLTPSNEIQVNTEADLTAAFGAAVPTQLNQGQSFAANVVITSNNGSVNGTEVTRYYLSTTPDLTGTTTLLDTVDESLSLAEGGTYAETPTLTIPSNMTLGTEYLVVRINALDSIPESNTSNDELASGPIAIISSTPLAAPTLSATNGKPAGGVRVNWTSVSGATVYQIFRNTTDDLSTATKIAGGVTGTMYNDSSAVPGQTYYYWVRGRSPTAIGLYSGFASAVATVGAPASVSASNGTIADGILVSWTAVYYAPSYQIWRSADSFFGDATEIQSAYSGLQYTDTTVNASQLYYYWVVANDGGLAGPNAGPASGYQPLDAPGNLQAVSDENAGGVELTWDLVPEASVYQVFRSTTNNINTAVKIVGAITDLNYLDTTAVTGTTYYYWVRARNPLSIGPFAGPEQVTE